MRRKQRVLLLVLMPLLFLCIHQISATSRGGVGNGEERGRTVAHAGSVGGGGGNGGSPVVSGGDGSSHVPSGGGMTPVYAAAGAGNNHHPHHGRGNCDRGGAAPEALAVITFACFLFCRSII